MPARAGRHTLLVAAGASALLLLDVTAVNVALPAIERGLGASFAELQWVIDAYALTLAAVLLTTGALADRLGRRRVFLAGLGVFAAASVLCGLAGSPVVLDVARALQGVGGAAMFACSLALLAHEFDGAARGRALGIWGAITGAALALGPLAGGALVDGLGWRWIFLLNLPLCALLAWLTVAGVRESRAAHPQPLDPPGAVTFTLGCFLVVFGLIRGNAEGWGSPLIAGALAGGAALLLAFGVIEARSRAPMLDPRLFRIPAFTGTAIVAFAQSFALYPLFLFLALWLQNVLGYGPLETGIRLLPLTLALFVVAPISGRLTGRVPLRFLLALGLALIGIGLLLMRAVETDSGWTVMLPGFVVGGAGIGVISPALAAAMVAVLSEAKTGLASGVNNTFRQLGIAVGIAALGAIFQARLGAAPEQVVPAAARAAFVDGLREIFLVAAIVALATVPLALALIRERDLTGSA
ncbi:MAG: MFS transporter [Solirubrobacteraceae bacterium]|nr:MFS transporter [Solirubrobacteraceae bacterium]